ncbi:MAG: hypothetical protein ACLP1Q_21405 [Solirubrobacteraceae bacterium]
MSERPPHTESEIVEFVRSIDVRAPQELHSRIEALVAERAPAHRHRAAPTRLGFAGALALAVVVVALVVALSGGSGSGLTLPKAVALTLRPATMAPPAENTHNGTELAADVEGIAFPYWEDRFGWRSTGARMDHLDGHTVQTVFYAHGHNQWIGYAIVAGKAPHVSGGVVRERAGTPYRFQSEDGASVVTWLRAGHLCVVAGRGVSKATLMALASWHGEGMLSA